MPSRFAIAAKPLPPGGPLYVRKMNQLVAIMPEMIPKAPHQRPHRRPILR